MATSGRMGRITTTTPATRRLGSVTRWDGCAGASTCRPIGRGKRLILHFEAVAGHAVVYVNGERVAENFDLFLPFEADITHLASPGESIEIRVGVRGHSLFNDNSTVGRRIVPAGSMWGQFIVGIWQDVFLFARPPVRVEDVYIKPLLSDGVLAAEVTFRNDLDEPVTLSLAGRVQPWINQADASTGDAARVAWELGETALVVPEVSVELGAGGSKTISLRAKVAGELKTWTPDAPNLYGLTLTASDSSGVVDKRYERFGWREWAFQGDKLLLNGEPIELRGDSWHFQGVPQMTRRYAWAWYTAIKEANGNAVRPHAQVYPRFYMDLADEMGVCVLAETANWASDGGPRFDAKEFWEHSDRHLERFVLRDRNHASVMGWSLTNENRPIIMHVFQRPDLMPVQVDAWARWVETCKRLDPTRPWISGDGDGDGDGTLPTVVGHYGDSNALRRWASKGKPWGVGEHSMAYYGTPKQVSKYNGQRSYESVLGRMEGLASECYDLIAKQREHGASYVSVFNLAWYGLKPLELGLADVTRAPTLEDGVFFTRPFREGAPGMQPERLGPYSTTFNPGYDPDLPLYDPWPMFEAIRDANAHGGPGDSPWAKRPETSPRTHSARREPYTMVAFIGDEGARLRARLAARGVPFSDSLGKGGRSLAIVDGESTISPSMLQSMETRVATGGDVLVWGLTPDNAERLSALLPQPVRTTDREATSLLVKSEAPVVAGLQHSDFYFSEMQKSPVMRRGLAGPFVEEGVVALAACDANWLRWNQVEESIKTAALLRSEREAKPPGAAFVTGRAGAGRVMISTLTDFYQTEHGLATLRAMLSNLGVELNDPRRVADGGLIDLDGRLRAALVCGSFPSETFAAAFHSDGLAGKVGARPEPGDLAAGHEWREVPSGPDGDFNFKRMRLDGPQQNAAAYMSFWVWSPRALDDLLIEPDMPKLDLVGGADDAYKVWLNGSLVAEQQRVGPLSPDEFRAATLPMQQGWNHFLVKVVQASGEWRFTARFECSDEQYMAQLQGAASVEASLQESGEAPE